LRETHLLFLKKEQREREKGEKRREGPKALVPPFIRSLKQILAK
jgi:hypothetical protein